MFERDDLLLRERLHDLRDAASSGRRHAPLTTTSATDGLLDRARRTLGVRLIALGVVVAGAGLPSVTADGASEDRSVSAA